MMNAPDVVELLNWCEHHRIDVWLNGGWGVDALLGHQTREHEDLDITISAADGAAYTAAMEAAGFRTYRVDNDFNWVLVDPRGRLVDVHLVDFSETLVTATGVRTYGPAGVPFEGVSLHGTRTNTLKPSKFDDPVFSVSRRTRLQAKDDG